jgi:hypothetical protein
MSRGVGSGFSEPYCSYNTQAFQLWVPVAFFFVPFLLCLTVATVCIAVVLVQFLMVSDVTSSFHVKNNLRLIAYLILSLIGGTFFITYRLYYGSGTGTVDSLTTQALGMYARCSVSYDNCPNNFVHNQGFTFCYYFFNFGAPILVSVVFLGQKELWTGWAERIAPWKAARLCFVSDPGDSSATSTTAGGSSSASGSGSDTFVSDLN